ncbi:MAG: cation-translocating P-type ATPase [Clostridia bacterium]|nr:cation-translocating P-type ATPase [Clostridia bacterium]
MVPADIRLIESSNLKIQEASLTGESVPVEKDADEKVKVGSPLGDRTNMAYSSSIVTYGRAEGVVVATGMNTEVGNIAEMLNEEDEFDTPIKRKLAAVGKTLSIAGIIICIVIFVIGLIYQRPWIPLLMTAISLAISIIPEGLPATATIVMALGVKRMVKENALVRKLPAVETLGSSTVICSDKTGTLTQNRMTVKELVIEENIKNKSTIKVEEIEKEDKEKYKELIYAGALCNDAALDPDKKDEILGDPTEGALIFLARDFGFDQEELEEKYEREYEEPFDSDRKRMSTIQKIDGKNIVYTKGAVDEMLELCTKILTPEGEREITDEDKENILELSITMSKKALRVLGFAKKEIEKIPEEDDIDVEYDLTFIGMCGMIDPPRPEVIEAIKTCKKAGIRTVMITGDHLITATAIAKELGIWKEGSNGILGEELDQMTDKELDETVKNTAVFARVSPNHKLRIIQSLKRIGEIAAMTGDGVNDAPALKNADIGIAMGLNGTDVAKDSADMILLDDDFTTIIYAVKEGRRVYRNIQKVIQFLLAGNIAEVLTLFIATLLNWEAPILAVHILCINLATDTLPALALGVDPASKDIMKEKPVKSGTLFEKALIARVILHGLFITLVTIIAYQIGLQTDSHIVGQTMAFIVLSISQMFHAFNQRSNTESIFTSGNGRNNQLLLAFVASFAVIFAILFIPGLRTIFSLTILTAKEWAIVIVLSILPLIMVEITKWIKRKFKLTII